MQRRQTVSNDLAQPDGRNNVQESHHPWGARNDRRPSSSESTQQRGVPTNSPTCARESRRSFPVLPTWQNHPNNPNNSQAAAAYSQIAISPQFPTNKFDGCKKEISRMIDLNDGVNYGRLLAALGVASSPVLKGMMDDFPNPLWQRRIPSLWRNSCS